MWSGMYLALFALAAGATYVYVVKEEAVVFTSAISAATWSLLAITGGSVDIVTDSGIETVALGGAQFLMAGLAVLSLLALIGTIIGWYPVDEQQHNSEFQV